MIATTGTPEKSESPDTSGTSTAVGAASTAEIVATAGLQRPQQQLEHRQQQCRKQHKITERYQGHFEEEGLKIKLMSPGATGTLTPAVNTATAVTQDIDKSRVSSRGNRNTSTGASNCKYVETTASAAWQ